MSYFSLANWWNSLIFSMLIWPIWLLESKIELANGINLFFAYWYNFMKIIVKVLGFGMVKNGFGQSCYGTLKLTVSEEWTDGINWFFCMLIHRFTKIKSWSKFFWVGIVKNGCGQSGHETLKLAVSSILDFACWYKFRKAKSWFNDFWVGLVKDGIGLLVHETLKSAAS